MLTDGREDSMWFKLDITRTLRQDLQCGAAMNNKQTLDSSLIHARPAQQFSIAFT